MTKRPSLIADIGGTNIRLAAIGEQGRLLHPESWLTGIYPGFAEAVEAYAGLTGLSLPFDKVAVAAAGPLMRERIILTNCDWVVTRSEIARATGASQVFLMNDFVAVAQALPVLTLDHVRQISGEAPDPEGPKAVLGPGTGLGVSSIVPVGRGLWRALPSEGGHVELAPANQRELAIVFQLQQTFGHVSAERVLSGPGLENLFLAMAALDGHSFKEKPTAEGIAARARQGDPLALEAVQLFTGWLGQVAGNLALTLGATGGVYLTGTIIRSWAELFDEARFAHRFKSKGRLSAYMGAIPLSIITARDIAFAGLKRVLDEMG